MDKHAGGARRAYESPAAVDCANRLAGVRVDVGVTGAELCKLCFQSGFAFEHQVAWPTERLVPHPTAWQLEPTASVRAYLSAAGVWGEGQGVQSEKLMLTPSGTGTVNTM